MTVPRPRTALALVALALAALLLPATPSTASENPQASIAPTAAPGVPRPFFILDLHAGRSVDDSVTVINKTAEPLTFDLYTADASNDETGAFVLGAQDDPDEAMGAWIHLPVDEITVPPQTAANVPFSIAVPRGTAAGDYAGGIVALARSSQALPSADGSASFRIRNGVGARIYGRVDGPTEVALAIEDVSVDRGSKLRSLVGLSTRAVVTFRVVNEGNVRVIPQSVVELTGPFGEVSTSVEQQLQELLPGDSQVVTAKLGGLTAWGRPSVRISAAAQGVTARESVTMLRVPWLLLALLALAATGLVIWWHERRRDAQPTDPDAAGGDGPGDALVSVGGWRTDG